MSLRSPLARVRHLGSAKDGTGHWWMQRVTAIALVPLAQAPRITTFCMGVAHSGFARRRQGASAAGLYIRRAG